MNVKETLRSCPDWLQLMQSMALAMIVCDVCDDSSTFTVGHLDMKLPYSESDPLASVPIFFDLTGRFQA